MPPLCRFSAPSQPTSTALGRLQPHCYTHPPSASQQGFASTLTPTVPRVPCTSFIAPPARLPRNRACLLLLLRRCRGFLGDSLRRVRQLEIHFEGRLRALLLQQRKLARPQSSCVRPTVDFRKRTQIWNKFSQLVNYAPKMADVESAPQGTSLDNTRASTSLDRIPGAAAVSASLPIPSPLFSILRTRGNFFTMNAGLRKMNLKNNRPASKKLPRKLARYVVPSTLHRLSSIVLTTYRSSLS